MLSTVLQLLQREGLSTLLTAIHLVSFITDIEETSTEFTILGVSCADLSLIWQS